MKKILLIALAFIAILSTDVQGQKKRQKAPPLSAEQRRQMKIAQDSVEYWMVYIKGDPKLSAAERKKQLNDARRKYIFKMRSILTPEQYAVIQKGHPQGITQTEQPYVFKGYQERAKNVLQTLDIQNDSIAVDFYDNGYVDGDTISVFLNGKLVSQHLGLSEKPATLTIRLDRNVPQNELVMYAENLGSIPPNTALMVVRDGKKSYNVTISSDTEKSGTVYFKPLTR
jgi:hypothetical protein